LGGTMDHSSGARGVHEGCVMGCDGVAYIVDGAGD